MTIDVVRWNRIAASTVVMVVILTMLNLFWKNSDSLLLDTIIISVLSSLADEAIRLVASPAVPGARAQALALGLVVAIGWAAALYLTRNSPERMSWILGGTLGLVGVGVVAGLVRAWRRRRTR